MESRRPPEYTLELSADRSNVKDVVKGILHTIFFHRLFTTLRPSTHDILDLTLPLITDSEIADLIETRTNAFIRQLDSASNSTQTSPQYSKTSTAPARGLIVLQFLEKKRRKSGWFVAKADEETIWENWIVDFTLTSARSEPVASRNRRQMEDKLLNAAMKITKIVAQERDHIPPITTNEANPFPFQILVNPKTDGWSHRMGIF